MRTAFVLWFLMALFFLRVVGQILVEFWQVRFLPPSEEWFSGLLPYPQLLTSQILILLLMVKIGLDFSRQAGWSYRPRVHVGSWLLVFGSVYLLVMIVRYVIRMSLYPHERWTGGSHFLSLGPRALRADAGASSLARSHSQGPRVSPGSVENCDETSRTIGRGAPHHRCRGGMGDVSTAAIAPGLEARHSTRRIRRADRTKRPLRNLR